MVLDGQTSSATGVLTDITSTSDDDNSVADLLEMERKKSFVEVKKAETNQTALFLPGPSWRQ